MGLDARSKVHQVQFEQASKKPRPTVGLPAGAQTPKGKEPLGQQMVKKAAKEAGLPEPKLPKAPGPFSHEVGQTPEMAALTARTLGRVQETAPLHHRALNKLIGGVRRFFIPRDLLKGSDKIGPNKEPRSEFYALADDELRIMQGTKRNMREIAASDLEHILGPQKHWTPQDYDLFSRKVMTDELLETARRGDSYSFPGMTREQATAQALREQQRLEPFVSKNPVVRDAYRRHLDFTREMGVELAVRGLIKPELREHYFHHQVMDFLRNQYGGRVAGEHYKAIANFYAGKQKTGELTGVKQYKPSQLKERGSAGTKDISRDYLRVMYEYLATTREALSIFDSLQLLGRKYHLANSPKQGYEAWAGQDLTKEGFSPPPGYTRYNLRSGFAAFRGETAGERLFGETLDKLGPDLAKAFGMSPEQYATLVNTLLPRSRALKPVKDLLGGRFMEEVVIPDELVETFKRVAQDRSLLGPKPLAVPNRWFKNLVLHKTPIQYNVRNLVGDFQRAVGQFGPEFMFDRQVWKETFEHVWQAYSKRNFSPLMEGAQQFNVTSSGRTAVEIEAIHQVPQFRRLMQMQGEVSPRSVWNAINSFFRALPRASSAREDLLRVYILNKNLKRMQSGQPMLTGIADIKGLEAEPFRAAAKIARKSLIDYGDFTPSENFLRNTFMPFYAWAAGNTQFWFQLMRAAGRGTVSPGNAAAVAALKGFTTITAISVLARVWNDYVMEDAERSLPEHLQESNHIVLPNPERFARDGVIEPMIYKDKSGKPRIMTVAVPDAADDFFDWFGLDGIAPDLKHVFSGRMDAKEYWTRRREDAIYKDGLPFPAFSNELANLLGPVAQVPAAASGVQLFPEPFRPRRVPPGQRGKAIAGAAGLGGVVDIIPGVSDAFPGYPTGVDVTDVPGQLGLRKVAPPLTGEDYFIRNQRVELSRLQTTLDEITSRIKRIRSTVASPQMSPEDREKFVAQLERERLSTISQIQKKAQRLVHLLKTAQPIQRGNR